MKLYSTNNPKNIVDLDEAVLNAFPIDRGLYMPSHINKLDASFFKNISDYHFKDLSFKVAEKLIGEYIPSASLKTIIDKAINFPAPLHFLDNNISTLELFHGPSMAFKDFGARFMAELMSYFLRNQNRKTTILVATSGDTGGAVAAGFHKVEGIEIIILYPSGKVSPIQEKQLTTWGDNIRAIEVSGVFDDCQSLVKEAFIDKDLHEKYTFSSANSINIARLIPQSFYYFEAYKQIQNKEQDIVFSVPSGNFGNLTAGVLAHKMGLPVHKFLAATNINDTVPEYLSTGQYKAKASLPTISNAMDVGNPSNFIRLSHLFGSTWNNMKKSINGYSYSDEETEKAMHQIYSQYNYIADPHGAIGYLACKDYLSYNQNTQTIFLETAHPAKFQDSVNKVLEFEMEIPEKLKAFDQKEKTAYNCTNNYNDFKNLLLEI